MTSEDTNGERDADLEPVCDVRQPGPQPDARPALDAPATPAPDRASAGPAARGTRTSARGLDDVQSGILALLRARTKHDFSAYRHNMLLRRIHRRMALCHLTELNAYLARLREDPKELALLCNDLLIGVTGFFRDPDAFELLQRRVLEPLVQEHLGRATREEPLRIWVPGCATGEETYSIAMLLVECFERHEAIPDIQVFATDVDEQALALARQGIYPKGIAGDVSEERLRRFFVHDKDGGYRVDKRLREAVVFAPQNLITDAPFSRLDLISCRNVLIYLEPPIQQRIIALFHFGLRPNGCLFLGPSENVGQQNARFETLSKTWRLFRRIGSRQISLPLPTTAAPAGAAPTTPETGLADEPHRDRASAAQRMLPASFVDLAEPKDTSADAPEMDTGANSHMAANAPWTRELELEHELLATREDLQTAIEELESANEELYASNEEAMSMNEELQSANEELETSKEELQSLNEELGNLNTELQNKVAELECSNNDISNLLASAEIATVFLDAGMRVKRFTPRATELLNLRPGDVGRPLRDLSPNVRDDKLLADAARVLDELTPREQDIGGDGDTCYLRRIQPYSTRDHRIEGVVISFIDITERTKAEQSIRASEARYRLLFERSPMCLLEEDWSRVPACLAEQGGSAGAALAEWALAHPQAAAECRAQVRINVLNRSAMSLVGFDDGADEPAAPEQWFPPEPAEGFLALLDDLLRARPSVQELVVDTRDGSRLPVLAHMVPVSGHQESLSRVLVAVTDISTRKAMEQTLAHREQRLSAILDTVAESVIGIDGDGRIIDVNAASGRLFGMASADLAGQPLARFLATDAAWQSVGGILDCVRLSARPATQGPVPCEGFRVDGSTFPAEVSSAEIGHTGTFVLVVRDMSQRRILERQVIDASTREQQRIGQDIHDGLGQQLAAAGMMAAALARKLERDGRTEAATATALCQHLEQAAQDAKDIVRGLRPVGIAPDGLSKALGNLAEQIAQTYGLSCNLAFDDGLNIDDADTATHLYRIAQEATSNAVRHGKASRIDIGVRRDGPRLDLRVRDDGIWSATEPSAGGGHGLQIMRYRAGILGGSFNVGPANGGGTLVQCKIPWPPHQQG